MEKRPAIDLYAMDTPAFVVSRPLLQKNLEKLDRVQKETGAKILLALKGFAMHALFDEVKQVLRGSCASAPDEARLGRECLGGEVHAFAPAVKETQLHDFLRYADHLVINSFSQLDWIRPILKERYPQVEWGLRVNPEFPLGHTELYDPCIPGSRLGIPKRAFAGQSLEGISGLHFHALCEQNSDVLEQMLEKVDEQFSDILPDMRWFNWGGGHHITREDYDLTKLIQLLKHYRDKYNVQIYLEPGEAVALNTGFLIAEVVDLLDYGTPVAILDTSASTHMPDVLEMPYRPHIWDSGEAGEKNHTYRLGGQTCLAGDIIGDYSFDMPLKIGQRLVFTDMAHYSMVKTTTFNGVRLPDIHILEGDASLTAVKQFSYFDYKNRLS